MSDLDEGEEGEVEQKSAGPVADEDEPEPTNVLTEDLISSGLSEVTRTANGESYAFSKLVIEEENVDELGVALRSFMHLRNLNLSRNELRNCDEVIHLPYLQDLDVSRNKLKDFRFLKDNPETLKYLKTIDFSLNQLRCLTDMPQASLHTINLQRNKIETDEAYNLTEFNGAQHLQVLKLQNNRITLLKGFENMPNLKELYLAGNKITSLDGLVLPALKKLEVQQNMIAVLDKVPALESLEVLNLTENKVEKESEIAKLAPLVKLATLNMTLNPLSDEKGDDFKKECLIALDMLHLAEVNEEEVTDDDRTDAKTEKEERIKAAKEAEEAAAEEAKLRAEEEAAKEGAGEEEADE